MLCACAVLPNRTAVACKMDELRSWWEVPSIAHFCSLFRNAFDLSDFDIEDLEEALLDSEKETGSEFITELLCKLLNGCYSRKDVSAANVDLYVKDVIKYKWAESPDSPVHQKGGFSELSLSEKVELIYAVCEYRLDAEDVIELLKGFDGDNMRVEPLGKDKEGGTYWYFYGSRLYKEDPPPKTELTKEEKRALERKKRQEAMKKKKEEKQRKKEEKKKLKVLNRSQKKKALAEKLKKKEEEKSSANIRRSGRIKLKQLEEADKSSESSDSSDTSSSESEESSTEEEEAASEVEEVEVKRGGRRKSGASTQQQEKTPVKKGKRQQNKATSKSTSKKQPPTRSSQGRRGTTTPRNQKTAEVSAAQSDPGIRRSSRIQRKHVKRPPPPKFDSDTEEEDMDEDNDSGHESAESDDDKSVKSEISKYSATSSVVKGSGGDRRRKVPMSKISLSKEFAKAAKEKGEDEDDDEDGEEKDQDADTEDEDEDLPVEDGENGKDEEADNAEDAETKTVDLTTESTETAMEENQQKEDDCDEGEVKCDPDSKPTDEKVEKIEDDSEIEAETNGGDIPENSDCKQTNDNSEVKTESKPDSPITQDTDEKGETNVKVDKNCVKSETDKDEMEAENNDSVKPDAEAEDDVKDDEKSESDTKEEDKTEVDTKPSVPVVKKPAVPPKKSDTPTRWHLVCSTLDDWTNLAEWFKESTVRCEKSLSKLITEDFLPVLPEIIEAREKEKLKRLKELEIRRSQRITHKQREKMESEKILAEALAAEERAKIQAEEERRIREEQQKLEEENRLREERARAREERSKRLLFREERARLIAEGKEIPQELIYTGSGRYKDDEDSDDSRCDLKEDEDYQNLMKVIGAMKIHQDCWPFLEPVTDEMAPGYSDVIKRPMDMSKIEMKVKNKDYRSSAHFLSDFRLMFNNCKRFNGQDSEFTECARSMERMLKKYAKRFMTDGVPEDSYYDDKDFKAGGNMRGSGEKRYRPRRAAGTRALQTVRKALDGEDEEESEEEAPTPKKSRGFPAKTLDSQSHLLQEMIELKRQREKNIAATALMNHQVVTRGPKHVQFPNAVGGVTIFSKEDLPPTGVLKMAATREIKRKVDPQLFGQRTDMVKRDPSLNIIDSRKPGSKPPKTIRIVAASQTLSGSASVKETAESVKVSSDGYLIIGGKNSGIKVSENTKIVIQPPGSQPGGPGANSPNIQAMTKEIMIKKIPTSSGDTAEISQPRPVASPANMSNSGAVTPQRPSAGMIASTPTNSAAAQSQVSSSTQGQATPQRQGQITLGSQGQAAPGYQGHFTPGSHGQVTPGSHGQITPGVPQRQITPQRQGQMTLGLQGHVAPVSQRQATQGALQRQIAPGANPAAVDQMINKALASSGIRMQNQNAPSTEFQKKQIDIAQRIVMLNEQKRKMMQQQRIQQNGSQPQAGSHFVESVSGSGPKVMRLDPSAANPGQRAVQGQRHQTIEDRLRDPAIDNQLGNVAKEVVSSVNIAGDILDSYYSVMNKGSKEEPVSGNTPSVIQTTAGFGGGSVMSKVSQESPKGNLTNTYTTVAYVSPSVSNSLRNKLLSHQPGSGDAPMQQHSNVMANGPVSHSQNIPRTVTSNSQNIPRTVPESQVVARAPNPASVGNPVASVTFSVKPVGPTQPVRYSNAPQAAAPIQQAAPAQAAPGQQRIRLPTTSSLATGGGNIKNVSTIYNQDGQVSIQTVLNSTRNMTGGKVQVNYPDIQQQPATSIALSLANFTLPQQKVTTVNPTSLPGHTPNIPTQNPGMVPQNCNDNNSFSPIEALFAGNTNTNAQQPINVPVNPQNTSIVQSSVPSASVNIIGSSPSKSDRTNLFDMFGTNTSVSLTAQANYSNNAAPGNLVTYNSSGLTNPVSYSSGSVNTNPVTYPSGLTNPLTYPIKLANPVSIQSVPPATGQAERPIEIDLESDSSQNDVELLSVQNPPPQLQSGAGNFAGSSSVDAVSIMDVLKAQLAQNRAAQSQEQQALVSQQSLPQTDLTVAFNTVELDNSPSYPCTDTLDTLDATPDMADDYTEITDADTNTYPDISLLQYESALDQEDFTLEEPEDNFGSSYDTMLHVNAPDKPVFALDTFEDQPQSFMVTSDADDDLAFAGTIQVNESNVDWVITEIMEDSVDVGAVAASISYNAPDVFSDASSICSDEFELDSEADMERAVDKESYMWSNPAAETITEERLSASDRMMSALAQALEDEGGEEDKVIDALDEEFEDEEEEEDESRSYTVEEGPSRQFEISSGLDNDDYIFDEPRQAELGSDTHQNFCEDTRNLIELPTQIHDDDDDDVDDYYAVMSETNRPALVTEYSEKFIVQPETSSQKEFKQDSPYRASCNNSMVYDSTGRPIEKVTQEAFVNASERRKIEIGYENRQEKEGISFDEIQRRQIEMANGYACNTLRLEESQNFKVFDSLAELQSLGKAKEGEPAKAMTTEEDKIYFKLSDSVLKSSATSVALCKRRYVRKRKASSSPYCATDNTAVADQTIKSADSEDMNQMSDSRTIEGADQQLQADKSNAYGQQEYQIGQSGGYLNLAEARSRQQIMFDDHFCCLPSGSTWKSYAVFSAESSNRGRGRGSRGRGTRSKSLSDVSLFQVSKTHGAEGFTEYCVRKKNANESIYEDVEVRETLDQQLDSYMYLSNTIVSNNISDSDSSGVPKDGASAVSAAPSFGSPSEDEEEEEISKMNAQKPVPEVFTLSSMRLNQKAKALAAKPAYKLPVIVKPQAVDQNSIKVEDTGVRMYRVRAVRSDGSVEQRGPHLEPLDPCMVPPYVRTEEVTLSSHVANPDVIRERRKNHFTQPINHCQYPLNIYDTGRCGNVGYCVTDQDLQKISDDILDLHERYIAFSDERSQEQRSGSVMSGRKLLSTMGRGVRGQNSQDCYNVTADWATGHGAQ